MRVAKVAAAAALLVTSSCAFLETGTDTTSSSGTPSSVSAPAPRPAPSAQAGAQAQSEGAPSAAGRSAKEAAQEQGAHRVRTGETVYSIARARGVDAYALITANKLTPPFDLTEGQRLINPGKTRQGRRSQAPSIAAASGAAEADAGHPVPRPQAAQAGAPERAGEQPAAVASQSHPASPVPEPPQGAGGFIWPVEGRILSDFGPKSGGRYNDGINIAAAAGTPVRAAEKGVVVYAGNELRGFGNVLLIKHAGGWMTAYAHNQALLVSRGDWVRRGQMIARAGSTGGVGEPQLHFEVRRGRRAVDPLEMLPRPSAQVGAGRNAG